MAKRLSSRKKDPTGITVAIRPLHSNPPEPGSTSAIGMLQLRSGTPPHKGRSCNYLRTLTAGERQINNGADDSTTLGPAINLIRGLNGEKPCSTP